MEAMRDALLHQFRLKAEDDVSEEVLKKKLESLYEHKYRDVVLLDNLGNASTAHLTFVEWLKKVLIPEPTSSPSPQKAQPIQDGSEDSDSPLALPQLYGLDKWFDDVMQSHLASLHTDDKKDCILPQLHVNALIGLLQAHMNSEIILMKEAGSQAIPCVTGTY